MPTLTKYEIELHKTIPKINHKIRYFFSSKIRGNIDKTKEVIKKHLQRLNKLEIYCGGAITEYKVVFRFTSSQSHDKNLIHGIHTKLKMKNLEYDSHEWVCHEYYYDNKINPPARHVMFKNALKNLYDYVKTRIKSLLQIIRYGDLDEYVCYYDEIMRKLKTST